MNLSFCGDGGEMLDWLLAGSKYAIPRELQNFLRHRPIAPLANKMDPPASLSDSQHLERRIGMCIFSYL